MTPELSDRQRDVMKAEKQAFSLAVTCMAVALVGYGGALLLVEWKTRQLKAAGLWPRHYIESLSIGLVGLLIAFGAGLAGLVFFVRWLLAIRDRRALSLVSPVVPQPPTE